MASKTTKPEETAAAATAPADKSPASPASVYTAEELAQNHKAFGTSREIVCVALKLANKKTATFSEAQKIIDTFRKKEVK